MRDARIRVCDRAGGEVDGCGFIPQKRGYRLAGEKIRKNCNFAVKQKNMNIEDFRNICLSMKGVTEKLPFSEERYAGLIVYYIGDKWFAVSDIDDSEYCNLKCDPDYSLELQGNYNGIVPGWHMNKRHWISVYYSSDVPDEVFKQLIENSYKLVYKSLTKKKRIEIENS